MNSPYLFPFSAIVGQDALKRVLILNAISPDIGGVLIRGEKGTAKSTAVRALSDILPEIQVVMGCPFVCDPDHVNGCPRCHNKKETFKVSRQRKKVITLPLNATEDCVIGGIDFNRAIKKGLREFQPGLLAKVHRGILYVDEVNLLDDHIVDIILDASASKENRVEREGISFSHPSDFILVGTMNPEEGELRPQLLDRFGLCIEVSSEKSPEQRVLMMRQRELFDQDPMALGTLFKSENQKLSEQIMASQKLLHSVRFPKQLRTVVTELTMEHHVAGHRADLVIEHASKAHAAFFNRMEVSLKDIQSVAHFALLHRKRDAAPPPPPPPPAPQQQQQDPKKNENEGEKAKEPLSDQHTDTTSPQNENGLKNETEDATDMTKDALKSSETKEKETVFDVGSTYQVKKINSKKDRRVRKGSGRRSRTRISQKQGRYVKSSMRNENKDIALDATIRAAAPYQKFRKNDHSLTICLKPSDIRGKIREKRMGNFLLFIVDASGSMGARGRMAATKGAVMSLLLDAYQKRDRIAMVSFRRDQAHVNLPPTSSIELAATLLKEMPVGGRTPLSMGISKGYELIHAAFLKDPSIKPIVILITDGKSNVAMGDQKPLDEAFLLAAKLSMDERIHPIVIDTEPEGMVTFGLAQKLAESMQGEYFKMDQLKSDELIDIVKGDMH